MFSPSQIPERRLLRWCLLPLVSILIVGCDVDTPEEAVEDTTVNSAEVDSDPPSESSSAIEDFEARYDEPRERPDSDDLAIGHALAVVGATDIDDESGGRLYWHDPADNLAGRRGIHRWDTPPAGSSIRVDGDGPWVTVGGRRARPIGFLIVRPRGLPNPPSASVPRRLDAPDLSQHRYEGWQNYCAPTAAASIVFGCAMTSPELALRFPRGPSASSDRLVDELIAGVAAPPPHADSLASHMTSSPTYGTSTGGLELGVRQFLESRIPSADWEVAWHDVATVGSAPDIVELVIGVVADGGGLVMGVIWDGDGPDANHGDNADDTGQADGRRTPPGDARTRGATQPRGNRGLPGVLPADADPGLNGSVGRSRPLTDTLPPIGLPEGIVQRTGPQERGVSDRSIHGRWSQQENGSEADIAPGNYASNTLLFKPGGSLEVRRVFSSHGGRDTLVFYFTYEIAADGKLKVERSGDREIGMSKIFQELVGATPATIRLPTATTFVIDGNKMRVFGKDFIRD